MNITDIFKIPLFRNFTQNMQEEFLDNLEYTIEKIPERSNDYPPGFPLYGHTCFAGRAVEC